MTSSDILFERNPAVDSLNWSEILQLLHQSFACMDGRIEPPSSLHKMDEEALEHKVRSETLVIARENGTLVGCMFCREEGAFLYTGKVAVAPSHQGQKIGRKLFDIAFRMAKQQGMMGLELEVRVEMIENIEFFKSLGFIKVGESAHAGYSRPTSHTMRAFTEPQ